MDERILSLEQAIRLLNRGGILLYPTETFYAIGCHPENTAGLARIYQLKDRPASKPLPLLAASLERAANVVDLANCPASLLSFWPGPLTLLLPVKKQLAQALINSQHKAAIRVSPHAAACAIARACGGFLPATSANPAGGRPGRDIRSLDRDWLAACARLGADFGICQGATGYPGSLDQPGYTEPSTLAEPLEIEGKIGLRILRAGCIPEAALTNRELQVIP